jgi:signal transduction histidine kinase
MSLIRVLAAEDDAVVRDAIEELLASDPSIELVGSAQDVDTAVALASRLHPDVAILDVRMPGGGGSAAARRIRVKSPDTRILAYSAYEDQASVVEMVRAGASGYVVKGTAGEDLLDGVRRCAHGQGVLSASVTAAVIDQVVTALERAERQASELQELDKVKRELFQTLAHELLTPVTVIQGVAITLVQRHGVLNEEEIESMLDGTQRASTRLQRLVANISVTAQLDREAVPIHTGATRVSELLVRLAEEFPRQRERLRLPTDASTLHMAVWAHPDLAIRALAAVVENALAFSPVDQTVDVTTRRRGSDVQICISDRGPGIPQDSKEMIFERFTQIDGSATRSHEGMGIGLYLARRVMSAQGGTITVEERPGGGSTFACTFRSLASVSPLSNGQR